MNEKQRFVYFIQAGNGPVKIGVAAESSKRLAELQTGNAETLRIIATIEGDYAREGKLHARFSDHRLRGEWFNADPVLSVLGEVHSPSFKTQETRPLFITCDICSLPIAKDRGVITWKTYDDEPGSYNHLVVHKSFDGYYCDDDENEKSMDVELAVTARGLQALVAFMLETNADAPRIAAIVHRLIEATR